MRTSLGGSNEFLISSLQIYLLAADTLLNGPARKLRIRSPTGPIKLKLPSLQTGVRRTMLFITKLRLRLASYRINLKKSDAGSWNS
jgi:hypothetical protein